MIIQGIETTRNYTTFSYGNKVKQEKLVTVSNHLRTMLEKSKIVIGEGAGKRQKGKRLALESWNNINNGMLHLQANINEGRNNSLTITVFHHSRKPMSFSGVPIILVNNASGNPQKHRFDKVQCSEEKQFEPTNNNGEFVACFSNVEPGSYSLKIGDPYLTLYGHRREIQ